MTLFKSEIECYQIKLILRKSEIRWILRLVYVEFKFILVRFGD